MSVTAVIPAAGKGTRLRMETAKIFTPIAASVSPWTILRDALRPLVDHIEIVLAPPTAQLFKQALVGLNAGVGISVQHQATGMGDAVFCADWHDADTIVVVWGDQIGINKATVSRSLATYEDHGVTIPMFKVRNPYVEYVWSNSDHDCTGDDCQAEVWLDAVLQSREGDVTSPWGWTDVGVFVLSTAGLREAWGSYLTEFSLTGGGVMGEVNFLPFLIHLVKQGWNFHWPMAFGPAEARGLNTPEDLEWARERFAK